MYQDYRHTKCQHNQLGKFNACLRHFACTKFGEGATRTCQRHLHLPVTCPSDIWENFTSSDTFTRHQKNWRDPRVNITISWSFGNMNNDKKPSEEGEQQNQQQELPQENQQQNNNFGEGGFEG